MTEVAEREKSEEDVGLIDTPEKSKSGQIATYLGKFEESPVFNFINSLSPIKPFISVHTNHTINSLNFTSLPSVFTSPHFTSFKEHRFLRRNLLPDPSKAEFSAVDESKDGGDETNTDDCKRLEDDETTNPKLSDDEVTLDPSHNISVFMVESVQDYNCDNPGPSSNHGAGLKSKYMSACDSDVPVPLVQEASLKISYEHKTNLKGSYHYDWNKEVPATCDDWENLIDASDLLIFQSPDVDNSSKKPVDQGTSFYTSIEYDMVQMQTCEVASGEQVAEDNETDNITTQPGECNDNVRENAENHENVAGYSINNPGEKMDDEHVPGIYRGSRRRCLLFDMKHLNEKNANIDSSIFPSQAEASIPIIEHQLVLANQGNESNRCVLPGIGLHLNSIASSPKDFKIINQDVTSASGRLLIGHSPSVNFRVLSSGQESLNNVASVESENVENSVLRVECSQQATGCTMNDEISRSSATKKRRRERTGEVEACKRCNCKKSKCLKLYCECFAAGVYCVEPCSCIDCFNKPIHEDTVLATRKQIESRNPLAFAPKVIRGSEQLSEIGEDSTRTPASARHKRGCNCKKSGCFKKYCECYQGGVGCSINCRCEGCKNAFGRKDGSVAMSIGLEAEEEDVMYKNEMDMKHHIDSQTPSTPLQLGRHLIIPQPFSSKSSSSANPGYESPSFFPSQPKFDNHFETINGEEGEIPDFLLQENSQTGGIKSPSPNGKRVSPPQGLRSSRKLILQSIPSFPSLTSNQW